MATNTPAAAPWRSTFLSHVKAMDAPLFTLGTLHPMGSSSSSSASGPQLTPRVRTLVFRGMWADLPVNPKNTADLNPAVYESDLPTFTTDVRMEKVPELFGTASASASPAPQSGPGGPVEAVFWADPAHTQWRLRGHAYVVGPDIDADAAAPVRAALDARMRGTGAAGSWGWARELTAHFGNLSPVMRGSFRNPPPGTPLSEEPGEGLGLGQRVNDLHDGIARANFRVVVVVPEEVERVDLTDLEQSKRWKYSWEPSENAGGSWRVAELWP